MTGGVALAVAGERLELLPERAVWLAEHATLLVADVHVGKAQSFRRLGVPVPAGTTADSLRRLSALVERWPARRLIVLGDFLHSAAAHGPATQMALAEWRLHHAALHITLIRGNHDSRAGDPPAALGIELADEPLPLGALALCHHPQRRTGAYVIAGHWHPCASIGGRIGDRLRLPCFWFGDEVERPVGVLPAFGAFTGMHPIEPAASDRVWGIADGHVVALPQHRRAGFASPAAARPAP